MSSLLEELAVQLFDAGAVRLGDIEAKVGRRTPIYFDLRVVVSHPKVMVSRSILYYIIARNCLVCALVAFE